MQADADVLQERARMAEEWRAWVASRALYVEEQAAFRAEAFGAAAAEPEFTVRRGEGRGGEGRGGEGLCFLGEPVGVVGGEGFAKPQPQA
jgi:hypothetical protein